MPLCGFCPLAFLGDVECLCGKPPVAPCFSFLSITEINPSSHSSHEMDAVQGDPCSVLTINLEGFILAVCRCAVKNTERAEASAWGLGERLNSSLSTQQPLQGWFHEDLSVCV